MPSILSSIRGRCSAVVHIFLTCVDKHLTLHLWSLCACFSNIGWPEQVLLLSILCCLFQHVLNAAGKLWDGFRPFALSQVASGIECILFIDIDCMCMQNIWWCGYFPPGFTLFFVCKYLKSWPTLLLCQGISKIRAFYCQQSVQDRFYKGTLKQSDHLGCSNIATTLLRSFHLKVALLMLKHSVQSWTFSVAALDFHQIVGTARSFPEFFVIVVAVLSIMAPPVDTWPHESRLQCSPNDLNSQCALVSFARRFQSKNVAIMEVILFVRISNKRCWTVVFTVKELWLAPHRT